MAEMKQTEHEGIVVQSLNNITTVRIVNQSACASCDAKGACTASDMQEKMIEVVSDKSYKPGQHVIVTGNKELGLKAAWWAYALPAILVIATLIISFYVTRQENLSGVFSLLVLIPYFVIIRLLNKYISGTFSFQIKSINE